LQVEFSARIARRIVCGTCHRQQDGLWWVSELDQPATQCECGGEAFALPFFTHKKLRYSDLTEIQHKPLKAWGVGSGSVLRLASDNKSVSFCIEAEVSSQRHGSGGSVDLG
jgi:hypothetical protein